MGRRVEDNNYEFKGNELGRCYKLMSRKWVFAIGAFFTLCAGASPMLMNVIMADMMNLMTSGKIDDSFTKEVGKLCIKMLYVVLGMTAATVIALGFRFYLNPCFLIDIRSKMYDSLMEQEIAFYDETPAGILIGRLAEDVTLIRFVYIEKLLMVIQEMAQAVVGLILAFAYVWRVTLAVFVGLPISAIVYIIGNIFISKCWKQYNKCITECINKNDMFSIKINSMKSKIHDIQNKNFFQKDFIESGKKFF